MAAIHRPVRLFAIFAAATFAAAAGASATLFAQPRFPRVESTSLAGRALTFPEEFGSPAALVFVAFKMKQQSEIDEWKAFVAKARADHPGLAVWELPTIGSGYKVMRGVIEGGMRSGIKDQAARESTATLYLNSKAFATDIGAGMGEIAVLVVTPDGKILGQAAGKPSPAG